MLVMRALHVEFMRQHPLSAPLTGALNFYELKEMTNMEQADLDLVLNTLVEKRRLRTRIDAVSNYRIYFLPARQRSLLRKSLTLTLSPRSSRIVPLVRIIRAA